MWQNTWIDCAMDLGESREGVIQNFGLAIWIIPILSCLFLLNMALVPGI